MYNYNQFAKEFTIKTWGLELNIPVITYSRKGGRNGFFRYRQHKRNNSYFYSPLEIKLNLNNLDHEEVIDTLKHELCHWYCCVSGLNFSDGDKDFEEQLNIVGASSTFTGKNKEVSLNIQEAVIKNAIQDVSFKIIDKDEIENIIKDSIALKKWYWFTVKNVYNVYYKGMLIGMIAKCNNNDWVDLLNNEEPRWSPTRKNLANELAGRAIRYMENN